MKQRSKYRSRKVERDGQKFDSQKEARRWDVLGQLAAQGEIAELRRQVSFVLAPAVRLEGEKRTKPALRYFADAVYQQAGHLVVEDTKSPATRKKESYRIKRHLMATVHGIHIKEI
jgi:TPP-dependent pyruvate/acetoin dehydrogenase alpha subunit